VPPVIAAYVYPGWHPCPERDKAFPPGWSEWDLVLSAQPHFPGHRQPNLPLDGPYDDSDPATAARQVRLARSFGLDLFVYGFFWSRGKRVLQRALDQGFLGALEPFPFALMWANRMPRRVLPVKRTRGSEIHPSRLVYTDPEDFLDLVRYVEERYFRLSSYFKVQGRPLFSIFDSTFFVRQMGRKTAARAIGLARDFLRSRGYPDFFLLALNPAPALIPELRSLGFDGASHYVLLPEWKGEYLQEYRSLARLRQSQWPEIQRDCGLPYFPSVSPGWDATPRAAIHGSRKVRRYPWWPVVVGRDPGLFRNHLLEALRFSSGKTEIGLTFIASWNEWSEGHYLEPDHTFGSAWLEAVRDARSCL